jgi:hypothetical protein
VACRLGSGFDCSNGAGHGTEAYRQVAAIVAALYTGMLESSKQRLRVPL